MRKLVDTVVLVCLLVGPALILTCVRQDAPTTSEPITQQDNLEEEQAPFDVFLLAEDSPRP